MDRLFITFETVEAAPHPDQEQAAAKPLFDRVVQCMRHRGADILNSPTEWEAYGWHVGVRAGSAKVTCMMQRSGTWMLMVISNRSFLDRLKGRSYEDELKTVASLVAGAVQEAFNVPLPMVQTEAELRAS